MAILLVIALGVKLLLTDRKQAPLASQSPLVSKSASPSSKQEPISTPNKEDCLVEFNELSKETWVSFDEASGRTRDILQKLNEQYAQGIGIGSGNLSDMLSHYATETSITATNPSTGTLYRVVLAKWCGEHLGREVMVLVDATHKQALSLLTNRDIDIKSFSDLDSDGSLELIVKGDNGGNCWGCNPLVVYRIKGGHLEDVLSRTIGKELYAPDDIFPLPKGMPGFGVSILDYRWEGKMGTPHCCGPSAEHYLSVNGNAVRDITREMYLSGQFNFQEMKKAIYDEGGIPLSRLVSLLLQYEVAGERKKGFEYFMEEYPKAAKTSINNILSEDWTKEVLKEIQRQYREQKSFTPFDLDT